MATDDIYSGIMDQEGADQASQLKQSMFVASKNEPDAAAQAQTIAKDTGVPADVVSRNKEQVQQKSTVDSLDYGDLIDNNPGLSKWLQDPNNSSVGHDDVANLKNHEDKVKEYGLLSWLGHSLTSGVAAAYSSVYRIPALAYDVAAIPQNIIGQAIGYKPMIVRSPDWLRNNFASKFYDAQQEAWSVPEMKKSITEQAMKGDYTGAGKSLVAQLISNAPNQAVIIGSAMMGAPMVGLGYAGATQAAQANKTAQESGVSPLAATADAVAQGGMEVIGEKLGTLSIFKKWESQLAKDIGKESSKQVMKNVGKTIAQSAFVEGTEEFATQAGQDFADWVTGVNPDGLKGIWQRAMDNGLIGAASGATLTAPAAVTSGAQRAKQLRVSENARDFYLSLGDTAEASKLRERMPEAHRQYIEGLVKDSPVENVYVPVQAWDMYMQEKGIDPSAMAGQVGVSAQYDQAKQAGTDIKIPLATWANKVVGTEHYQGLANDMKFDPGNQTVNEVKAEGEQIKAELAKADEMAKAEASKEIMTPEADKIVSEQAAQVSQKVADQLKATGKFSPEDIKHLSSLWGNFSRVFGGRTGQLPLEFFNKNPLTVQNADSVNPQQGQQELNQFAGPESQTAPLDALDQANSQERFGVSPETIRQETGWFRGMDKKWRYEISDRDILIEDRFAPSHFKPELYPLEEVYNHPVLFAAYPDLKNIKVKFNEKGGTAAASFNPKTNVIEINERTDRVRMTQSLVHEIQHAIQEKENFGRGGSVQQFQLTQTQGEALTAEVTDINKQLKESVGKPEYQDLLDKRQKIVDVLQKGSYSGAFDQYAKLAGEVEARDAAQRAFMDEAQRKDQQPEIRQDATVVYGGREFQLHNQTPNDKVVPLGAIIFGKEGGLDIKLLKDMNYSTFLHETGHAFLELMRRSAQSPDAPGDIQNMSENVLKWFNIESWDQLERKHHEQFAQGFEKYLFEGKAPSVGLRQAFARFRVWLVSVYKTLQGLNVELSDSIRGVMDRMLATDQEIEAAQAEQGPLQMIQDPISILGDEKGKRYLDALEETKQESQAGLQLKLMEEYQRARKSWWMDELKKVYADVAKEVNVRPEQIALSILQRGKMPDGTDVPSTMKDLKISREDLIRFYSNKFDIEVAATDMNAMEKEFNVDQLEGSLRDIEQFREQVGKIKKYENDYLKEELAKMPRRYVTSNKFAKTLDEAASDLGFESDMDLLDRMIDNEAAFKSINEELVQARKDLRSVKKLTRQEKYKSIRDAMGALPRNISSDAGISVNVVGQLFGYSTADQFLDVMSRVKKRNDLIKEISLDKMKSEHGELLGDKQAMGEQAMQAIHNEKKETLLRMELEYLASQHVPVLKDLIRTVSARIPSSQFVKQYAAETIGKVKLNELSAYQYQLAERRSAKAAGVALTQGKFEEAFDAKKKELLNYELYRAATAAKNNIEKSLDGFKKIAKSDEKISKARDLDYVNAARSILALHGIGEQIEDPYQYLKNTQAYDPDTFETLSALVDAATENVGNYQTISYDQFVNMKNAVDAIWEISRRSRQIQIEDQKMDIEEVRKHLIDRMVELNKKGNKGGYTKSATENDKFKRALLGAVAQGRRVESWTDYMDAGNKGWFTKAIWNPIVEGTQKFRIENKSYTEKFLELIKPVERTLINKEIVSDELKHIFHSKAELLGALLHTGNESNLSKLLRGRGWGMYSAEGVLDTSRWDAFISRMQREGTLNKADYDFIQSVWDLFESMKSDAQKAHKEMYGYYFNSITADEFATPWGKYRGGYAPAIADPFVSEDAAIRKEKADAEQTNNSYMFPTTGRGFTKGRIERYAAPLAMDLRLVPQHINKVLRFTHIEPRVKDVGRIIRNPEFREYLRDLDPVAGQHMLSPWLQRAAQQIIETPDKSWAGWRVWRELRTRSGINIMAGSVVNTLQQFTGLSIAAVKVKPKYLAAATLNFMKNPKLVGNTIHESSDFMKTRTTTHIIEIQKTIDDIILNENKYAKALDFAKRHAYFMQQGTQNVVDMIVWPGAYDQSVAEGNSHDQAVRDADSAVRQTQGDFSAENVSNLETGNSFARAFLMFYSYFNMQANLLGTEFGKVSRDLGLKRGAGRGFYVYLMGFMLPAVVSQAIMQALSGQPWDKDDDGYLDDFLAMFFGSQFQTATAMFPFVGQVANVAVNKFNNKWYDDDIKASPAVSMIESAAHSPYSVYKAISEDGHKKAAIHDVLSLMGILTGFPVAPLSKPLGYLSDVSEGNTYPENTLDFTRGLITGKSGK